MPSAELPEYRVKPIDAPSVGVEARDLIPYRVAARLFSSPEGSGHWVVINAFTFFHSSTAATAMPSSPLPRAKISINEHKVDQLSPDITIVHPIARHAGGNVDNPAMVLLFGWTAAPESPLQKYVEGHASTFPAATVVVVRVHAGFFFRSLKSREAALQPLLGYLTDQLYDQTKTPSRGVLIHALSNGGVLQLMTLHGMLQRRFPPKSQDIGPPPISQSPS
ncbi:hypothetical protein EYR38_002446 [Pleurotus pulmonarius]|nr:hypothetical protein EYR38_002446 [Pleurotus pulmonarius]